MPITQSIGSDTNSAEEENRIIFFDKIIKTVNRKVVKNVTVHDSWFFSRLRGKNQDNIF